jgi:hypothetical protein
MDIADEISRDVQEKVKKGNAVMISVEEVYNNNKIQYF